MTQSTKEVFTLSNEVTAFINTEVMPSIEGMNNAVIKKDEFLFNASESVAELFENAEVFDIEFWNAVFLHIETQAISKFKIAESTAKNYSKDIVAFLKLRNPAILKPVSTNADAVRKQVNKTKDAELLNEFKDVDVKELSNLIVPLVDKSDKDSIDEFKKYTKVIKLKKDALDAEKKEQDKTAKATFKEKYFKDTKDIFNDEYEFAQYLHANLENYRKAFKKAK